jgi:alkylation response protein AidB-like acyl-CoA dehydrogenase
LVTTRGRKRAQSLTTFAVEDEIEGFRVDVLPEKNGVKILPTGKLIYENSVEPRENLIGGEGRGLLLALKAIDKSRLLLAGIGCGVTCRILDEVFN